MVAPEQTITQRLSVMRLDSIRSKILLFAVLATLLPSLTTAWISYMENRRALTAKASEELLSASTQAARELDLWIKERRYDLRVFASSYEVTENLERLLRARGEARPARERLNDYLQAVRARFADYYELAIIDAGGRVVASSGGRASTVSLPDDWRGQLRGRDLLLGTPYWNASQGRAELLVGVPIGASGPDLLGALTATVNIGALAETLRRFAPRTSGEAYLASEDGRLIVSSRGSSQQLMQRVMRPTAMSEQPGRAGVATEFVNFSGRNVVGSLRRVPGASWIVVAEIASEDVFRELARLRNVTLLIVTAMLAVAGGLGYSLGLFIVRPLDRLTRGAAKVAGGNLEVDLPIATGGEVGYLTRVFNNMVTRLRASHTELERLSVTDALTGVFNRRRMMEALEDEVRRSRRLKHAFAVLMADVDHFKRYNDAHGHPAGDEVLKRIGAILRECTRDVDFVARYGGEEFFVLLPELGAEGASELAERVRGRLAHERFPGGAVTLSFGVAEFPAHGESGATLIATADAMLYQAKREGRDRVVVAPLTRASQGRRVMSR